MVASLSEHDAHGLLSGWISCGRDCDIRATMRLLLFWKDAELWRSVDVSAACGWICLASEFVERLSCRSISRGNLAWDDRGHRMLIPRTARLKCCQAARGCSFYSTYRVRVESSMFPSSRDWDPWKVLLSCWRLIDQEHFHEHGEWFFSSSVNAYKSSNQDGCFTAQSQQPLHPWTDRWWRRDPYLKHLLPLHSLGFGTAWAVSSR
jgi:hypothetical protein